MEDMFYPAFVFLCLSVFLLATSRKATDRILMKILPEMYLYSGKMVTSWKTKPRLDTAPSMIF